MTLPTNGSLTGPPPREELAWTERLRQSRGAQLHARVRADLVGSHAHLADRLSLADADHGDFTAVDRVVAVTAQYATRPALGHALIRAGSDRDDRVGALHRVLDHAAGDRVGL